MYLPLVKNILDLLRHQKLTVYPRFNVRARMEAAKQTPAWAKDNSPSCRLSMPDTVSPVRTTPAGLKSTCVMWKPAAARSIFEWLLEVKPENGLGQHFYFRGRLKERVFARHQPRRRTRPRLKFDALKPLGPLRDQF
jgi:hypothetical protein